MPASKDIVLEKNSSTLKPEPAHAGSPQRIPEKKRSKGVTFCGWIHVVVGALGIIRTFLISAFRDYQIINIGAPFMLVIGIGLLKLKEWARKSVIIYYILIVLAFPVAIVVGSLYSEILSMLIDYIPQFIIVGVVIYFFTRPKVKEQFRKGGVRWV
jgi:hypothetical protein